MQSANGAAFREDHMTKYLPQIVVGALAFALGAVVTDQLKKNGVIG